MPDSAIEARPARFAPADTGLRELERIVLKHYRPELWDATKTALAVVCSLSIGERAHPLALIFEGPSGRGKSTVINMFRPDRSETAGFLYRLDAFTPKSFVSHAANVAPEKLAGIDLLPKIKNKTLLIKELAPVFRGRETEIRQNFSMLTAVLDGKGLRSSSGVHGTRGYEGDYLFNWLGGTTPIPESTDEIMAQLGNRLLRYEIVGEPEPDEDLLEFAASYQPSSAENECQQAVNDFLCRHFERYRIETIDPREIRLSEDAKKKLVDFANLISCGRVEITTDRAWQGEPEFVAGSPEGPHRVILLLRTLVQGLAIIDGRNEIVPADLDILRHVAFSSIPRARRKILQAVLIAGGGGDFRRSGNAARDLRTHCPKVDEATRGHGDRKMLGRVWQCL